MISLSVFSRRRMNGPVARRRRAAAAPSRQRSIGVANCSRKLPAEPSSPGFRKSRIECSSLSRFSTGVPVSATRWRARSARIARVCLASRVLMFCASSSTIRCHSIASSVSRSRSASAYVVTTRSFARAARVNACPFSRSRP